MLAAIKDQLATVKKIVLLSDTGEVEVTGMDHEYEKMLQENPEEYDFPDLEGVREEVGDDFPKKLFHGTGCRQCQGSGYRGRSGIFELMPITEPIRNLILEHGSVSEIRKTAARQGMRSLRDDGWRLVREGRTTLEEVLRATKDERFLDTGKPEAQEPEKPAEEQASAAAG